LELLLINGASGSGKTTLAEALSEILEESHWVHPDGLFPDTPQMGAEEILEKSLSWASTNVRARRVVIDCQIRPSALDRLVRNSSVDSCEAILLTCPRAIRELRLRERGWPEDHFERIENWALILRRESDEAGMLIFDTSVESVQSICRKVDERLRKDT
jgi:adenylate kinase family enzyme